MIKTKFKVGDLVKHNKYNAIHRISEITDDGYKTLNDDFISFSDEGNWETFNHESWEPQSGDIFRKIGTDKPWFQLCNEDGEYNPTLKWSFVQIMESGAAGGEITTFALKDSYELVERHMTLDEALDMFIAEPFKKSLEAESFKKSIEITPEFLEKNGFVKNEHVYPYPYYEYVNEKLQIQVGYAFPSGSKKTKYKENWLEVDGKDIAVLHLPCKYVYQIKMFFETFLKILLMD